MPWRERPARSAAFCSSWRFLSRMQVKSLGRAGLSCAHGVKEAGDKAHVADLQHEVPLRQGQALQGQGHSLGGGIIVHGADALQAHLADLPEGVALLAGAVDVLHVIVASAAAGLHLGVLGDGEGHIRLEGQQPPVQVREGDDLLAGEKPAVLLIEPVLLEAAHVVLGKPARSYSSRSCKETRSWGLRMLRSNSMDMSPPDGPWARFFHRVYFTLFY